MNLLEKYTPHELMEKTLKDLENRQIKREREIRSYQFNISDTIKKKCGMRRASSGC